MSESSADNIINFRPSGRPVLRVVDRVDPAVDVVDVVIRDLLDHPLELINDVVTQRELRIQRELGDIFNRKITPTQKGDK